MTKNKLNKQIASLYENLRELNQYLKCQVCKWSNNQYTRSKEQTQSNNI